MSVVPPPMSTTMLPEGSVTGSPAPMGIATRAPGGYRVTGRWSWATAVHHADWVILGGMIPEEKRHRERYLTGSTGAVKGDLPLNRAIEMLDPRVHGAHDDAVPKPVRPHLDR